METPQPAYRPELFVNHVAEIERVQQAVKEALTPKPTKPKRTRAITFYGERGSGKTWLSRHLGIGLAAPCTDPASNSQERTNCVEVLTLFLAPPKSELDANATQPCENCYFFDESSASQQTPEAIVLEMLRWVCRRWRVTCDEHASATDLLYWLGRDLPRREVAAFVLIVDSVFEFGKGNERLPLLEDQLLTPIASLDNGLVVMTGRGAPFPWRSVPLRQENIEVVLPPFHAQEVGEQLARSDRPIDPARAAQIHALGGGYPLNNYVLGQADPPEAGLEQLVEVLLDFVRRDQQRSVREALEALCVLDCFREREIAIMVAHQRHTAELSMDEARHVRDLLLDNYLMYWNDDGFVINESVRVAYRSYLRYRDPSRFATMTEQAIQMYRAWSEKYPNARAHYRRQAEQLEQLLATVNVQAPTPVR